MKIDRDEAIKSVTTALRELPSDGEINESVNHPAHYQREGGVECIDDIEAELGIHSAIAFCEGNVIKYQFRAGNKPGADRETDLAKAKWYEEKARQLRKKQTYSDYLKGRALDLQIYCDSMDTCEECPFVVGKNKDTRGCIFCRSILHNPADWDLTEI